MQMTLTKRELRTLWSALEDAIRDRAAFEDAYTPRFGKPRGEALRQIRLTQRQIAKYRAMQQEIGKLISPRKVTDARAKSQDD